MGIAKTIDISKLSEAQQNLFKSLLSSSARDQNRKKKQIHVG